jgi:hypothetical protein
LSLFFFLFYSERWGVKGSDAFQTSSPIQLPILPFRVTQCFTLTRHWRPTNGDITVAPVMEKMSLHNVSRETQRSGSATRQLIARLVTYYGEIHYLELPKHTAGWNFSPQHMRGSGVRYT